MEEDLIIKKIFINDYIINTSLLKNSVSKLLINTLSNKFYKTNKLDYKINNLLNKIENIFIETSSGDKIFNLSYQPYNQYNIVDNYNNNNFNKKWIIPIVNETKTLNHNVVKVTFYDYYNTEDTLIKKVDEDTYFYNEQEINIKTADNFFQDENDINYKIEHVNLLGNLTPMETPVLSTNEHIYNFNDPNNVISSLSSNKVIRTKTNEEKLYQITSYGDLISSTPKGIKIIDKNITESFHEVRNILINENINIKKFLILNPLKLLHTNYNITLGNTISYLNEIMNTTFINIDTIINNYEDDLNSINLEDNNNIIDYLIVDKDELSNQYNNDENYIYDYLKIIKNLDRFDNQIYSIRILKYIYNIFGYDLNKVPHCYIIYLQNILANNISKYINNNTSLLNYLIDTFKKYKSSINNNDKPDIIQTISKLYEIDNIIYNKNDSVYNILHNNTHDNGLLYYLNVYKNTYLNNTTSNTFTIDNTQLENTISDCNYRIVKIYNTQEDYDNDNTKFIDLNFSLNNYLIEYDDLIYNLQQNNSSTYQFKNKIYIHDKKNINDTKNIKDSKPEDIATIKDFIENNKLYIYNLILNTYDINIVFTKYLLLYYKNKRYFQIPYKTIENENIILINNIPFKYNNDSLTQENKDLDTLEKEISLRCYNKNIENSNIEDLNKFYKDLNSFNIEQHNIHISNLINIYEKDNNFNNFLLSKSSSYVKSQLYFKNIEKIVYPINTYDQTILINYLLNYNISSIKTGNLSEDDLLNEISNSIYNTDYIKQIKTISDKINDSKGKNLWNYIHHYVNEYELLTNVIVDGDKYNRAYYKLWEILLDNKITDKPDFKLISLAESPGNFVKCVQNLRSSDWNDYIICTLLDDANTINQGNFFNTYKNYIFGNPNGRLKLTKSEDKDFNGDLTKSSDITTFIKHIETNNLYADLITADGGIKKDSDIDYLLEEYNHLPLFLGEIITALFTQKLGGTFILKMYDIVYINSVNLINLLSGFYKNVHIIKPYNSRPCNTEKYIICSEFIGINTTSTNKNKIFNNLLSILSNLTNSSKSTYKHFNIFENLPNNEQNISKIIEFNNSIIVKTQLLHLQDIYDIIIKNDKKQLDLIKTYFGPKRNFNIKNILSSEDNEDKGYFIKKIESCIILALYMKINNQPLKTEYIDYYSLIKNMKTSVLNTNIYPPHFKEIYEINKEENKSIQVDKINKFIKKYCIVFEKPGIHKIIDYYILRTVEHFMLNKDIINLNHSIINIIRENKTNLSNLHKYLEELCKITDIKKLFYLENNNVISLIKNFQNNIRLYLGYYLCKYTYIPIYPKYKALDSVIDQVDKYGILYNSQYICYYSGDKFDMEEFDDFMGDNMFRTNNISLFEEEVSSINNKSILTISKSYNNDLSIEENICSFILNQFKLDNTIKLEILNRLHYINTSLLDDTIDIIQKNYNSFLILVNRKYEKSIQKAQQQKKENKDKTAQSFFKLDEKQLEKEDIIINIKIKNIIDILNKNKNLLTLDKQLNKDHLLIKTFYGLLLSKYFNTTYINTIIYTLVQITNYTTTFDIKNIYNNYIRFEKKLIEFIYINSPDLFNILKNKLLQDYLLPIKLPSSLNETTKLEDILNLNNNPIINDILLNHINPEKNSWNPFVIWKTLQTKNKKSFDEKLSQFNKSKNVLEFLKNIPYIDKGKSDIELCKLLKDNKLTNSNISKLNLDLSMYLTKDIFIELCETLNTQFISNLTFNSTESIESNIKDNRLDLVNKTLLDYKTNISVFSPNYDVTPPTIYNSKEIYIYNCIKYLYLYVYESDSEHFGKKRIYDNDICLYTTNTKKNILNTINELSNDTIIELYKNTFNSNYKIINNSEFVNKNILDDSFKSLIYNSIYRIDNNYIDLFYTLIKLFYPTKESNLKEDELDIFKNIIMRFYNDPITNIINFLDLYKSDFIVFTQSVSLPNVYDFNSIIENIYSSKDIELFNIINTINSNNYRSINDSLISKIKEYSSKLNDFDIKIEYDLNIKDIITLINNMKKSLSYISNISNKNILYDLKNNKYKQIKGQYTSYEYNILVEIIEKYNYKFNLAEFEEEDFDYIQIVFTEILEEFNYNFNNIYSVNIIITKHVLLLKLYKIIDICLNKLNNAYNFNINSDLKTKFYMSENKIQQSKSDSTVFDLSEFSNTNKKYLNLFLSILSDTINNLNNYSSVISRLNPDKYIDTDSISFDSNDFNDITDMFDDGLMGDEEEMD